MSACKEQDSAANELSPAGRGRNTVRAMTLFAFCEMAAGLLIAASRSARSEFYSATLDEWPIWAALLQIVAMPVILRVYGIPPTGSARVRIVAVNLSLGGFIALGFYHQVERLLYRFLELVLRLLIPAAWLFATLGILPVVWKITRRRRESERKPFLIGRMWFACLIGLTLSELACGWLLRQELKLTFPGPLPSAPEKELHVAAIGGSSMLGHPYQPKYGLAEVAAWRLRQLYPNRSVRLHNLAVGGFNLREAIARLHRLKTRPDLLLVYSGHNEFYRDLDDVERSTESPFRVLDPILMKSPTFVLTYRLLSSRAAIKDLKKDLARNINEASATLIRDHIAPGAVYRQRLVRFREQLRQLAEYCRTNDIATIWFVPAANEADWDPNRSSLSTIRIAGGEPELRRLHREALEREAAGKTQDAIDLYRRGLKAQPELAEFHYRLGRCLLKQSRDREAAFHLQRALDVDGHPIRANVDYRALVATVAKEAQIPLIDSPALLRKHTQHGILDRTLFHDNVHPTLKTFYLLGTAACKRIESDARLQKRLGPPEPIANPGFAQSLADAGMTPDDLSLAYARSAFGVRWLTRCRFDAQWRLSLAEQLQRWSDRLKTGEMLPGDDGSESLPLPGPETPVVHDASPDGNPAQDERCN